MFCEGLPEPLGPELGVTAAWRLDTQKSRVETRLQGADDRLTF